MSFRNVAWKSNSRVRIVAELCELGYADRMVLSHDAACHSEWLDSDTMAQDNPEWSLFFITQSVVPALAARGVSDRDLTTMLELNPQRLLGLTPSPTAAPQEFGAPS